MVATTNKQIQRLGYLPKMKTKKLDDDMQKIYF